MATPLSTKLDWQLMNPILASVLNPVLANPANSISILEGIQLKSGSNIINHGLGHEMNGWFLVDIQGVASVYRSAPMNTLTLTLTSSTQVTCSIGVF